MPELLHKKTDPIYTLSVASKLSNTPQHSIRQYIDKGLIIPFKKNSKRHLFSENDIYRLLWLRKQLDEKGLNFAGIKAIYSLIPCWKIKSCDMDARKICEAYNTSGYPCWEASNKGPDCKNTDCRTCNVYQVLGNDMEIKTILKEMLP